MTETDHGQKPVSIDVGLSAKASLEIKTEIPKEVTGRVVSALLDVIRPFTEGRGLRADNIRLQREEVALEIAQIARRRAEIDGISINPVSTKFLVPFMEKASLEDSDKGLRERWAALLLSAGTSEKSRHLTFIDILSRLSSNELNLLEDVCFSYERFPQTMRPGGHYDVNAQNVEAASKHLLYGNHQIHEAIPNFKKQFVFEYGSLMFAAVEHNNSGGRSYHYEGGRRPFSELMETLQILEREQLMRTRTIYKSDRPLIGYCEATYLGISFVSDCSPRAKEVAARAPGSVFAKKASHEQIELVHLGLDSAVLTPLTKGSPE